MRVSLPELVQRKADKSLARFCRECAVHRLRYSGGDGVYIIWQLATNAGRTAAERPVAQLRYQQQLGQWSLHYCRPDGRWRLYLNSGPTLDLDKLLEHLALDPYQTFWV